MQQHETNTLHNTTQPIRYPTDRTRLSVASWRRQVEAVLLRLKCGPALETHDVPMEGLSDVQRAAAMQMQGYLQQCLSHDRVALDQMLGEQSLIRGSHLHGARLFRIMCLSFREDTPEELRQLRNELNEALRRSLHIDSTPEAVQTLANGITRGHRHPPSPLTRPRIPPAAHVLVLVAHRPRRHARRLAPLALPMWYFAQMS